MNGQNKLKPCNVNWIGRSEGVEIQFSVAGSSYDFTIYTTRPDTLFGVTYVAIAHNIRWHKKQPS